MKKLSDEEILKVFERTLRLALISVKIQNPRGGDFTTTVDQMKLTEMLFRWLLDQEVSGVTVEAGKE